MSTLLTAQHANFVEINIDQVRFYHQLVLEYFAAIELKNKDIIEYLQEPEIYVEDMIYRRAQKWDRVVIALCGIIEDPNEIILSILDNNDPILAAMCIESGITVSKHVQEEVKFKLSHYDLLLDDFLLYETYEFDSIVKQYDQGRINANDIVSTFSLAYEFNVEWLSEILNNDWRRTAREVAAHMLYEIGNQDAIPSLFQALHDPSWFVASAAANAIIRVGNSEDRKKALKWYREQNS